MCKSVAVSWLILLWCPVQTCLLTPGGRQLTYTERLKMAFLLGEPDK